ncbi:MAG TPA: type III secretion system export apparatus subunit SctR [Thermoanaerobaculia bacterium]|nr:type III secretion system export apparatus subunit SctR [Thermoanaerobaculia bacterium]
MSAAFLLAQAGGAGELGANPISTVIFLGLLALLPFILMMTTSFLKFAVVLSILRNALGTQQIPPNPVILGLAVILTAYVMSPVAAEIYDNLQGEIEADTQTETFSARGARDILDAIDRAKPPLQGFLARHAHREEVELFHHWARQMGPPSWKEELTSDDLIVLIPAFAISELTEAFAIGFLLFLPFLVIDMVVSNILLAMGMHMLSPVVVSLPFKLLLFIMIDGWSMLAQGLLQAYLVT